MENPVPEREARIRGGLPTSQKQDDHLGLAAGSNENWELCKPQPCLVIFDKRE